MENLRQFLDVESLVGPSLMFLGVLIVAVLGVYTARGFWRRQPGGEVFRRTPLESRPPTIVGPARPSEGEVDPRPGPRRATVERQADDSAATRAALAEIAQRAAAVRAKTDRNGILTLDVPARAEPARQPQPAPPRPSAPPPRPDRQAAERVGAHSSPSRDRLDLAEKLARNLARRSVHRRTSHGQASAVGLLGYSDELTRAIMALFEHRDGARPLAGIDSVLAELELGNAMAAEGVFRTILEQKRRGGRAMMYEAAQAARSLAAIARLRDEYEARIVYEEAVTLDDQDPVAWNELGHLRRRAKQYDLAAQAYERVLAIGNQSGSRPATAAAVGNLGVIAMAQGNYDGAVIRFGEALALARDLGDSAGEAAAFGNLGLAHQAKGDLGRAEQNLIAALALHEELDMHERVAADHGRLGLVYDASEMLDQAETHLRDALEIAQRVGDRAVQAVHAGGLGVVQQKRGDFAGALASHSLALAVAKETGRDEDVAHQHGYLGIVGYRLGRLEEACGHWRAAFAIYQSRGRGDRAARIGQWMDYAKCPEGKRAQ